MMATTSKPPGAGPAGPRSHARKGRPAAVDRAALAALSGTVTALESQKKEPRRRSLYVDGAFVLGLHVESVILAGLKVGQTVDGARLVKAFELEQGKRAKDDALFMLSVAARTRRDVEKKLLPRYGPELTLAVVEQLANGGWLDDAEFARAYIRSHPDYGARRLAADLARRGVSREVAGRAVQEALGGSSQLEQARAAAATRMARMQGVDRETAQRRLSGFLSRRGYGFEIIAAVLGPLLSDLPRAQARWANQLGTKGGLARKSSLGRGRSAPEEDEL